VVITSAHIDDKVAVQCMGRCVATIPKPIHAGTLLTCLDKLRKSCARSTPLPPSTVRCEFSGRQIEVIRAAAEGLSEKETAIRIGCGLRTVGTYWQRIFEKAHCRTKAAVIAILAGQRPDDGSS
jgi:DNA-binding NarL/FixJ family response regulator